MCALEQNYNMPAVDFDEHYLYIMWDDMMLTFDPDNRVHFGRCDKEQNYHITSLTKMLKKLNMQL